MPRVKNDYQGILFKVTQSQSEGRLYTTRKSMVEKSIKRSTQKAECQIMMDGNVLLSRCIQV